MASGPAIVAFEAIALPITPCIEIEVTTPTELTLSTSQLAPVNLRQRSHQGVLIEASGRPESRRSAAPSSLTAAARATDLVKTKTVAKTMTDFARGFFPCQAASQ